MERRTQIGLFLRGGVIMVDCVICGKSLDVPYEYCPDHMPDDYFERRVCIHDWSDWGVSQNVVHKWWFAHRWCRKCGMTHRQKLKEPNQSD